MIKKDKASFPTIVILAKSDWSVIPTVLLNKFSLLDVQFMTNHLRNMGAKEISRALFLHLLKKSTSEKKSLKKS